MFGSLMHAVKWLQAESVIYDHCTGTEYWLTDFISTYFIYCKETIDQCQLQWYLGQFLRAPAGPVFRLDLEVGFFKWVVTL